MEDDNQAIDPGQTPVPHEEPSAAVTDNVLTGSEETSFWQRVKGNTKTYNLLRRTFILLLTFLSVCFICAFLIYIVPAIQEIPTGGKIRPVNSEELKKTAAYKKQIGLLTRDIDRLSRKYSSYTTGQSYLVVNTTDNLFYLYRNKKLIREGHCSSGSYKMLKTEEGQSWVFKTPKGKFSIQGKTTNPYWYRPDWSFVEEGLPIPSKDDPVRWEYGVLGDYAMSIGEGYLIHGTIWKRLLGMPVTHGCVRLNDKDLEAVFRELNLGSKVYIF
jgi:hypothetical protein